MTVIVPLTVGAISRGSFAIAIVSRGKRKHATRYKANKQLHGISVKNTDCFACDLGYCERRDNPRRDTALSVISII